MTSVKGRAGGDVARRLGQMQRVQRLSTRGAMLFQRQMLKRAVDITAAVERRSCLVIAPHPDDETLGCGATMARKLAAGAAVSVIVVSDGRFANPSEVITPSELASIREAESIEALARLGLASNEINFLRVEDGAVAAAIPEVADAIEDSIREHSPDEIYVPSSVDGHSDHRAVAAAAAIAVAGARRGLTMNSYPIWFWDPRAWVDREANLVTQAAQLVTAPPRSIRRLHPQRVSIGEFDRAKRHALDAYASQLTRLSGEETWPTFSDEFLRFFTGEDELFFAGS